jgi:hypothetical protein
MLAGLHSVLCRTLYKRDKKCFIPALCWKSRLRANKTRPIYISTNLSKNFDLKSNGNIHQSLICFPSNVTDPLIPVRYVIYKSFKFMRAVIEIVGYYSTVFICLIKPSCVIVYYYAVYCLGEKRLWLDITALYVALVIDLLIVYYYVVSFFSNKGLTVL